MKIYEIVSNIISETASAGATSSANIGTVVNRRINAANFHSAATLEDHRHQTERILQAIAPAQ
jgi:hypothetical protein